MHSGAAFPLHLAPLDPNFLLLLFLPQPLSTPPPQQVEAGLGAALQKGYDAVGAPCVTGLLSLRVSISGADGSVTSIDRLADTLVVDPAQLQGGKEPEAARNAVVQTLMDALAMRSRRPPLRHAARTLRLLCRLYSTNAVDVYSL